MKRRGTSTGAQDWSDTVTAPCSDGRVLSVSVVILSLNEEVHIARCIRNVKLWAQRVFVVDCFSTDQTAAIARRMGADVVQHAWEGHQARQMNWALDHLPLDTDWVLRLDADEYMSDELVGEMRRRLDSLPADVTAVSFPLRRVFLGRPIRHGLPAIRLVRLFRTGQARCEQRWMDEHICVLHGDVVAFKGTFTDDNLKNIGWWIEKHNGYALREAVELLNSEYDLFRFDTKHPCAEKSKMPPPAVKRSVKCRLKALYARLPLFVRPAAYFFFRYIIMGGFLDGREGFLWHFLQGWWYRTLVDAKLLEIKRKSGGDREQILLLLATEYKLPIPLKCSPEIAGCDD